MRGKDKEDRVVASSTGVVNLGQGMAFGWIVSTTAFGAVGGCILMKSGEGPNYVDSFLSI